MATTAKHAIPYPGVPGDHARLWEHFAALAAAIDVLVASYSESTAAARPAAGKAGRLHRATDTGAWSVDTGAAWVELATGPVGAYLPLAGGTLSGELNLADQALRRPLLRDYAEVASVVAASGAARTLDCEVANVWDVTLDQACTLSFANPPASGRCGSLLLVLRQPAAARAVTWPSSVDWPSGTAPAVGANGSVHLLGFVTLDGGGVWLGLPAGLGMA